MDNTNSMMERLDEFLLDVQKPSRYIGGETGSVVKDKSKVDIRFAFCFPDTYEIGMSHLGMKILYGLKNAVPNYWCERVFMPPAVRAGKPRPDKGLRFHRIYASI